MESITDLAPEIQKRISNVSKYFHQRGMKRPIVKFISSMLTSMIKERHVHVTVLARSLRESIALKKTWERLNRNLSKHGLGDEVISAIMSKHQGTIRRLPYCVIDTSDIQKPQATRMEGLCMVRDGDKSEQGKEPVIGKGFHWINGVMVGGNELIPVSSEIYSLDHEGTDHMSENKKILAITERVHEIHSEAIYVLDRGGDRLQLLRPLLEDEKRFIIRSQGLRSLRVHRDSTRLHNIKEIANRTKPSYTFKSYRNGEIFDVGIRHVYVGEHSLWLVASRRRKNGALSWYVTNLTGSRREIMSRVMEGYSLRWRVEEYHRQIKQDFKLERICLRNYHAIKNMGVMVMLASAFCSVLPQPLIIKLLALSQLLPRKRLSDIPTYPYYMITAAVAQVIIGAVKRRSKPIQQRIRDYFQLNLNLGVS